MGRKMGKTEGEAGTTHQSPKAEKRGKRTDSRNQSRKNGRDDTENGGKPQGRHANGKGKTVICRVGSERSPCPRLRYPLMGQEEDFVWKTPGGVTHWDIITRQNIPRQIFSLTLYYASWVASLAKSQTFPQLGRQYRSVFSGGKLPQGILCPENRRLERAGIRPPSYLLDGTW